MKEVPRRREQGNETNEHGEDVMRWRVIPMQFYVIIYGMELYRQYADKHVTLNNIVCVRASGASASLDNCGIFTFLNCCFFQYVVGTLKISQGLIFHGGGGGGGQAPPSLPPPLHQYARG